MMRFVFCSDPLQPREVDSAFAAEAEAARIAYGALAGPDQAGGSILLIDHDRLAREGDAAAAVRAVPRQEPETLAVYRGWMLRAEQYARLYEALAKRGVRLINSPEVYRTCHHLPEFYRLIEEFTPRSVWIETATETANEPKVEPPLERILDALRPFGSQPLIVKDYVKSRKHEWFEACYIPSASDADAVARVTRRFLELQGDELVGGLVYREFVEFEPAGTHPQSGMPLTNEHRLFWLDGALMQRGRYWAEGDYPEGDCAEGGHSTDAVPIDRFAAVARHVPSRFFSMDVAKRRDGEWMIVELGDGQVTGLPEGFDVPRFFALLAKLGCRWCG